MVNPLADILQPEAPSMGAAPDVEEDITGDVQRNNMQLMDAPIPGQSLTREPGSTPYERPPEFATENEAMDFLFEKVTRPDIQTNLLRAMDAGMPIPILIEPILMHGAQEGKWSIDMAMTLLEPLGVILYGMGRRAGITPKVDVPKKEKDKGLNPKPFAEIFKSKVETREKALKGPDISAQAGLLSRPKGE